MNRKIAKLGEKTNLSEYDVKKFSKIGISGFLTLILSIFTIGLGDSGAAEIKPQPGKNKTRPLSERCRLKPESGPCKGNFIKYYFDAVTNKCKTFTYGGCDGVVPFETQEECENACIAPEFPVSKYGVVSIRDFENAK